MARIRMVTRTIEVIEVNALCVDITTSQTETRTLELTGAGSLSDEALLKALKKTYETDALKVVAITSRTKREELYGLTELDFLKYAKKLDPETRKMLETTECEAESTEPEVNTEPEEAPAPKKSRKK